MLEASKPLEEVQPAIQSAEQHAATEKIAVQTQLLDDLAVRKNEAVAQLGHHKTALQQTSEFRETVNALRRNVEAEKESFKNEVWRPWLRRGSGHQFDCEP